MSWWDYGHRFIVEAERIPNGNLFQEGLPQNPRFITGTIITQGLTREVVELGNFELKRYMCFVGDGVEGNLHVALEGNAGEQYVYVHRENISTREWAGIILATGADRGYWELPEIVQDPDQFRPGYIEIMEPLVGFEKLHEQTGWEPRTTWEEGIGQTIDWYAENEQAWIGRVDWK